MSNRHFDKTKICEKGFVKSYSKLFSILPLTIDLFSALEFYNELTEELILKRMHSEMGITKTNCPELPDIVKLL